MAFYVHVYSYRWRLTLSIGDAPFLAKSSEANAALRADYSKVIIEVYM